LKQSISLSFDNYSRLTYVDKTQIHVDKFRKTRA